MVSVEVLDQNDDVEAKRNDDGVDLGGTMGIGLAKMLVPVMCDPLGIEPVCQWPRNQSSFERHEFHACSRRY